MNYRKVGKSGLRVSELSLGSWLTYGFSVDDNIAESVINAAYESGINSFDTADGYNLGAAERVLGKALKHYDRTSLVVASKVYFPMGTGPNDRGLSRKHMTEQLDASLKRLDMDYIDILYCHRYDETVPLSETLRTMDDFVRRGKVMYLGVSEWTAAQISEALGVQDHYLLDHIVVNQPLYNLLNTRLEKEVMPFCAEKGIGQMTFSPLGMGMLSGKYKKDSEPPEGSRVTNPDIGSWMKADYFSDVNFDKVEKLRKIADEIGISLVHLSLAWILSHKEVSSAIIGASKKEQIYDNVKAVDIVLDSKVLAQIDQAIS